MANFRYIMSAEDIAKELNCLKSHACKIVKELNRELAGQGNIRTYSEGDLGADGRTDRGQRKVAV